MRCFMKFLSTSHSNLVPTSHSVAMTTRKAKYSESMPFANPFYTSSGYLDDLATAAAFLHHATGSSTYLIQGKGRGCPETSPQRSVCVCVCCNFCEWVQSMSWAPMCDDVFTPRTLQTFSTNGLAVGRAGTAGTGTTSNGQQPSCCTELTQVSCLPRTSSIRSSETGARSRPLPRHALLCLPRVLH